MLSNYWPFNSGAFGNQNLIQIKTEMILVTNDLKIY